MAWQRRDRVVARAAAARRGGAEKGWRREGAARAHLDDKALLIGHKGADLAALAAAQPNLLGGDGDDTVGEIDEEDRARYRREDDAAILALGNRNLQAKSPRRRVGLGRSARERSPLGRLRPPET